jgi:ferredoxin
MSLSRNLGTEEGRDVLKITVPDPVLGQNLELSADLLTLSAAVDPADSAKDVARLFKVSLNADGFFQEAHVKLRPVDFAAEGVFLCGTAQYPKHITETISQAYGAAGRAISILAGDSVTASGAVCDVNEHDCVSCGACIAACTYGAITFVDTPEGKKARVEPILCKGDGLCNAKCPSGAIYLKHYTDDEGPQINKTGVVDLERRYACRRSLSISPMLSAFCALGERTRLRTCLEFPDYNIQVKQRLSGSCVPVELTWRLCSDRSQTERTVCMSAVAGRANAIT